MTEDPVLASDGVTYERHSIESWFQNRMTKGVCVCVVPFVLPGTINGLFFELTHHLCHDLQVLLFAAPHTGLQCPIYI